MTGLPVQSSRWLRDRGPRWLVPLLVGCALALLLGLHAQRYWPLTVDDAAISFTYARNLAAGHGLVLDPGGEPVEAYSNPLWVGLLALLHLFRLPLEPGAKLLGLGFAWGSLLLLPVGATLLVRSRSSRVRRPAPGAEGVTASVSLPLAGAIPDWWLAVTVVTALLVAGTPRFVLWSVAGLESGLHGFLLCALLAVLLFERESERAPYGTALLLLLLLATRPEAPLYWAVVGAAAAIRLLRQLPDQRRAEGRRLGRALLPLLLGGGLLLGLRLWLFDAWLPNSYRIKAASFPFAPGSLFDPQGAGWQYLGTFVLRETLLPHLVILLLGLLPRRGRSSYLLGLGLLGAGFLFPLLAGGDWMPQHRFLAPLLPLLLLLTAASLGRLTLALSRQPLILGQPLLAGRVGWGALLLLAVMVVPRVVQLRSGAPVALSGFTTFATVAERGRAFGSLAGTLQLSRASLLDPAIGGTSFASGLAVHDLFGLADRALPGIRWQPPLVRAHLLHELEPTFVHLHGAWLSAYYLHEYPELDTLYLPLPARLAGVELGPGRHYLRRGDLLSPWFPVEPSGRGRFDSLGVQLVHVDLGGGGGRPGDVLQLLLRFLVLRPLVEEPEVVVRLGSRALSGTVGVLETETALPLGRGLPVASFRPGEQLLLPVRLSIPVTAAPGRYALQVGLRASAASVGLQPSQAGLRLLPAGEIDVGPEAGVAARQRLLQAIREALVSARQDRLRSLLPRLRRQDGGQGSPELRQAEEAVAAALSSSALLLADAGDLLTAATKLQQARTAAPGLASVAHLAPLLATRLAARGRTAASAGDPDTAFLLLDAALALTPSRAAYRTALERERQERTGAHDPERVLTAWEAGRRHGLDPTSAQLQAALALLARGDGVLDGQALELCPLEGCGFSLDPAGRTLLAQAHRRLGDLSTALLLVDPGSLPEAPLEAGLLRQELTALLGLQPRPGEVSQLLARLPGQCQVPFLPDLEIRGVALALDDDERTELRLFLHRTGASVSGGRILVQVEAESSGRFVRQVRDLLLPGGRIASVGLPLRLAAGTHRFRVSPLEPAGPAAELGELRVRNPNLTFELGTMAGWQAEGAAFAGSPIGTGKVGDQGMVTGWRGRYFLNGYAGGGDRPTGTLTSPAFTLEQPRLGFLVGGGRQPGKLAVRLLVDGEVVREATGPGQDRLVPIRWDVSPWAGRPARVQLVDRATGAWGHLLFDDLRQLPATVQAAADAAAAVDPAVAPGDPASP